MTQQHDRPQPVPEGYGDDQPTVNQTGDQRGEQPTVRRNGHQTGAYRTTGRQPGAHPATPPPPSRPPTGGVVPQGDRPPGGYQGSTYRGGGYSASEYRPTAYEGGQPTGPPVPARPPAAPGSGVPGGAVAPRSGVPGRPGSGVPVRPVAPGSGVPGGGAVAPRSGPGGRALVPYSPAPGSATHRARHAATSSAPPPIEPTGPLPVSAPPRPPSRAVGRGGRSGGHTEPARPGSRPAGDPPGRPLDALRIPTMTADPAGLACLTMPVESAGVAIGRVSTGELVTFRMFRDTPRRVALIGGLWPLRMLVFRALGTGARVVVRTYRPNDWQRFGRWAVGTNDRLALLGQTQKLSTRGVAASPVLVVHDMGRWVDPAFEQLGPWQTLLSAVPDLAGGGDVLTETDAVLSQRVSGPEAQAIQAAYRLDDEIAHTLCQLTDDMLGVLGDGDDRVVWTVPTGVELRAFGEPHRL